MHLQTSVWKVLIEQRMKVGYLALAVRLDCKVPSVQPTGKTSVLGSLVKVTRHHRFLKPFLVKDGKTSPMREPCYDILMMFIVVQQGHQL